MGMAMEREFSSPYELILARIRVLEKEVADLREQLAELEDDAHEAWLGGND